MKVFIKSRFLFLLFPVFMGSVLHGSEEGGDPRPTGPWSNDNENGVAVVAFSFHQPSEQDPDKGLVQSGRIEKKDVGVMAGPGLLKTLASVERPSSTWPKNILVGFIEQNAQVTRKGLLGDTVTVEVGPTVVWQGTLNSDEQYLEIAQSIYDALTVKDPFKPHDDEQIQDGTFDDLFD